jgi:VacB/RNase II family 3'-5' exoribonuclease
LSPNKRRVTANRNRNRDAHKTHESSSQESGVPEHHNSNRTYNLAQLAEEAMAAHGFEANFSKAALDQATALREAVKDASDGFEDLTHLPWCSIDNDDSRDLDQVSVSADLPGGATKILVGVSDVDVLVQQNSPLDLHARRNTTSIYTGVRTFPMFPERLSWDLTSLNADEDRRAFIFEFVVESDGRIGASRIYKAWVRNKAKLTYNGVTAWLEGKTPLPPETAQVPELEAQIRAQDAAAQRLRMARHEHGALDLETLQPRAVTENNVVLDLVADYQNRAQELIEDLMVAANGVTARYLTSKGFPTFRRVVRSPERWLRIVATAEALGCSLPDEPDSKALNKFLMEQKAKDPLRFPDLSLTVVKLLGRGEYVMETPNQEPLGHFGLAVRDYSHSTAPNRRYPDLVTHRLLKAALSGTTPPPLGDLEALAAHCTERENQADKVERQVRKSAGAALLSHRIGETFDAIVTGASDKGTWVRALKPPVEGRVVHGEAGLDVGDRCCVKLLEVNIPNGWIDFAVIR